MKYRVTRRGWIVFSTLGAILIFSIFSLINHFTSQVPDSVLVPDVQVEDTSQDVEEPVETTPEVIEVVEVEETPVEVEETIEEVVEEPIEIDMDKRTDILFEKNVSELNEQYYSDLMSWAELLYENQDLSVVIEGHVNGYPYYNDQEFAKALSTDRAVVVKQFLIDLGIKDEQIEIKIIGSQKQVDKENNDNFHLNRRAVIYFDNSSLDE